MTELRVGLWLAALAGCFAIDLLSMVDAVHYLAALATALAPLTVVIAGGSLMLSMSVRRWLLAVASAGVLVTAMFVTVLPFSTNEFLTPTPGIAATEGDIVVVSSNVRVGNDELSELILDVAAVAPDVIVFLEISNAELETIRASSLAASHPHEIADPRDGYFGSAIVSRLPIAGGAVQIGGYPMIEATVATGDGDVGLVGVHVAPPISAHSFGLWTEQMAALETKLRVADRPTVLIGDFNGTPHHRRLRRLDAASASSGMGVGPSYSVASWAPPMLALDHVFTAGGACIADATMLDAAGSDHQALRAVIDRSYSPDASCR